MEKELSRRSIYLIPVYSPFPLGSINVYLLAHEPLTLIDCGPNLPRSLSSLEKGLAEAGFSLQDIRRVIITHEHPDHYGLVKTVVARKTPGGLFALLGRIWGTGIRHRICP
jgi:glyoxylase-like metal-dependent hydrolase (beta-lactamase superfamily II)